ncbi:long-chain-fatty-acid--CoA ligase [Rhodococcoides fascians]|uniref:long-chain-fatty-acid--CoA ligase n=1 Tax=Rhodococcoides fascians TaxID=1828 RepID=UPI000A456E7F|nr:long-chain-fatty-acid--CoA ligase [Rhodococcus fascians]
MTSILDRARRVFGDRTVVSRIDGGTRTLTYAELFGRVDRLSHALRGLGVKQGDRVGTMAWNHHRHLELYLAVTSSGAVLHTINVRLAADQVVQVAEHAGDVVVFVDSDLTELLKAATARLLDLRAVVRMGEGEPSDGLVDYEALLASQVAEPFEYPRLTEEMPAATSYSSATTGTPKGVVYTHRAMYLHSMMLGLADTWAISESDTILPVVPMFHVNAWGLPFTGLWMGATLVLPGERPTPAAVLDLMVDHGVTFAAAVPTVWMEVVRLARGRGESLQSLRLLVSGGAPLPRALLVDADELGLPMIHSYGMTEASPLVLVGAMRSDAPTDEARMDLRLRQGYVVPGLDYRVEDSDGRPVPWDGESVGELKLRGPWVAEEYERDERSASAFVDGWFHTGDIVTIDGQGYLHVVDRVNDLIKSGGEWISSIELEDALMNHPAVESAAVVAVPDERWQERPKAFVVLRDEIDTDELRRYLADKFPRFWVPDTIKTIDAIPLTSVGKFDKKSLRSLSDRS